MIVGVPIRGYKNQGRIDLCARIVGEERARKPLDTVKFFYSALNIDI